MPLISACKSSRIVSEESFGNCVASDVFFKCLLSHVVITNHSPCNLRYFILITPVSTWRKMLTCLFVSSPWHCYAPANMGLQDLQGIKAKANGGKNKTVRMLLNRELWSLCYCISPVSSKHSLSTVLDVPQLIIGSRVPPNLGFVKTHMLHACKGLVCHVFPRRPVCEDYEEKWEAEAWFLKTWGTSGFLVRILRKGGLMKEFYLSKSLSQLALHGSLERHGLRMKRDKGQNRQNDRNDFPLSV